MKRYVKELANDLKANAKDIAKVFSGMPEVDEIVRERLALIDSILEQCEYGYISDVTAVELLLDSGKAKKDLRKAPAEC